MKYLIQHFIEDSLRNFASDIAVKQGDRQYTYGEIDQLSDRFACYFDNERPALVGILSRVRVEAIVAMVGALKAGVVYVPLNTLAPVPWLANVIKSAGIEVLLVDPAYLEAAQSLRQHGIKHIVCLEDSEEKFTQVESCYATICTGTQGSHSSTRVALADDIAYVLYTSGSTGSPKGILITHRNAYTFIDWMAREFKLTKSDRIFNRAPLQFDLSVFDIFSTFAAGATLVIAAMGHSNNPDDVVALMRQEQITIVYTVPSSFISWLSKGALAGGISSLRLVLYAGEPFPVPYLRKFLQAMSGTVVANIYGPTETNIVTYYYVDSLADDCESVPIGKPVHDTEIFIVDDQLQAVPHGEIGEILVRGGTVFAGYFNDPVRTSEKLVQSPFHIHPTLCCRTGDLGRILPDGNIAYHGRADNLVKTRGYRVEIGEIETALSSIVGVNELSVIARPHEKYGNTLHAFVSAGSDTTIKTITEALALIIPSYMMPYEFIAMADLPKTSTGKIDRVKLRESLDSRSVK